MCAFKSTPDGLRRNNTGTQKALIANRVLPIGHQGTVLWVEQITDMIFIIRCIFWFTIVRRT